MTEKMEGRKKTRERLKDHEVEYSQQSTSRVHRRQRQHHRQKKEEKLGNVSVWFGKEEKEIQNLSMKTTVNEVIQALAKDENDTTASLDNRNWVIVESWRGIERPLPPRTKLLKVWCSWKAEQPFVKFYLKKSSSISFRHNQPSKSLRSRRKRPNFIGAKETFIDGPIAVLHESSAATSGSTTTTTTSSGDTFGSSAELSLTTTTNSTSASTSTSSSTSEDDADAKKQDAELRLLISECVERQDKIEQQGEAEVRLVEQISTVEFEINTAAMRDELDELAEQVHLVEERISSLNHVAAGLHANIAAEKRKCFSEATLENEEYMERARAIQTRIEAHLFVNLQLAAESDNLADELEQIERSIVARDNLLDNLDTYDFTRNPEVIEDQILAYVESHQRTLEPSEPIEMVERERQRKTSSMSGTSGHCSQSSFDVSENCPKPSCAKSGEGGVQTKSVNFDSDSSLPDSDSALSSMGSSETSHKPMKPMATVREMIRETLV